MLGVSQTSMTVKKQNISDADIAKYFDKDINVAWSNCFKVWRKFGRVQDFPHGENRPKYIRTLGKRLGQSFAKKYRDDYSFVISKLYEKDPIAIICAYDILELIAWEFYSDKLALPGDFLLINLPIPEPARSEIKSAYQFSGFSGSTIGEFLPFLVENG